MDAKELRGESALAERSSDGGAKFAASAPAPQYDRTKPCQELGPNAFKVDSQGARPCAVIGPDRVAPPARDAFPKKAPVEPWLSPDSLYRRPPDYPHKMSEYQDPTRNISPRQTFQENMQRIIMPSGYNTVKGNEETAYASKNIKLNMPMEAKYCDVPYNVNPTGSDQKNLRNSDHSVSNVNPLLVRSVPHGWPTGSVSVRPLRPYGAPEVYQYPEYASCTGPRAPLSRTHSSSHEEPPPLYPEPYYHEGNIRYKPYPNIKDRFPQTRYEYLGNYANPYHSPHPFAAHKYELPKTMPNQPYPGYPSAPLKYTDRAPEPNIDGYQRTFSQQTNYGVPFRNPVIHPPYRSVPGIPLHNKLHPYPSEGHNKPPVSNKQPYDPNNKMYIDYENSRPKTYPMSDNFYLSDMPRQYTKNPIILPNYAPANMHGVNPFIQLKNYEYARYRSLDPSIINNPLTKVPMQFSPTTLAISPADSSASNDTAQTHGTSQEDCGYVSQCSITSGRSIDSRLPMDVYGRHDYRYSPMVRGSSLATPAPVCNQMSKSKKDIRQFISSWSEGDEENVENTSKRDVIKTISTETHTFSKQFEHGDSQEQLYVLGLVNVPSEELGKYEHIQKVSKLPENIKGYNSLELLNQFEEAIESSNINSINPPMQREIQIQTPLKTMTHKQDAIPRAISPLDVEAKISQSVIHKDVGCNFEIKPCSPKMLNVQVAAPVQTILNERVIEKVANPQSRKSPLVLQHSNENMDSILNNKLMKYPLTSISSSCKMVNNQLLSESPAVDHLKTNYSLQELETNLGVCLASLPRLDNDIELNFPEVNQQFINANKTESVITKSFVKDLPALEIERADINPLKNNSESELGTSHSFSPKGKIDTDKEFSRLSKYRKLKKNIKDDNDMSQAKAQATRVDSVIIKNPDNTRIHEDNTNTYHAGAYSRKNSQEFAINLATQSKNSQAHYELEKKLIKSNDQENTENYSPSNFMMPPKTDNYCDDIQSDDQSMTYNDISNRYLDRAVLDMPMNLSPQAKSSTYGEDEDVKSNKISDNFIQKDRNVITKSDLDCDVHNTSIENSHEEIIGKDQGDDSQNHEPFVDSIQKNVNTSPVSYTLHRSTAKKKRVSSSNSDTELFSQLEHPVSNLNSDTKFLPTAEDETVSNLLSDTLACGGDEDVKSNKISDNIKQKVRIVITKGDLDCDVHNTSIENSHEEIKGKEGDDRQIQEPFVGSIRNNVNTSPVSYTLHRSTAKERHVSSSNSDTELFAKLEHPASNLHSDSKFLPTAEDETASNLLSDTLALTKPEECSEPILNSDTMMLPKTDEQKVSRPGSPTLALPETEQHTVSKLNSETQILSESRDHTTCILDPGTLVLSKSDSCTTPNLNSNTKSLSKTEECHPEQKETIYLSTGKTIESSDLLRPRVHETDTAYHINKNKTSRPFDDSNDTQESLGTISSDERSLGEKSDMMAERDIIQENHRKSVDNDNTVHLSELKKNKNKPSISRLKRSTECISASDVRSLNKKHKFTLQNENENFLDTSTDEIRQTSDVNFDNNTPSHIESNISVIIAKEIDFTKASESREVSTTPEIPEHLNNGNQHKDTSNLLEYDNTVPENLCTDSFLNVEKNALDNTNVDFILKTPSSSKLESKTSEKGNEFECSVDDNLEKRDTPFLSDTNKHRSNNDNHTLEETKRVPLKIKGKLQETEAWHSEDVSQNHASRLCIVSDEKKDDNKKITNADASLLIRGNTCTRKELFSSRFQNLLTYNEGASSFVKITETKTHPDVQKNSLNLNSINNGHTEIDVTKLFLLTEIHQQICGTILPNSTETKEEQNTGITNIVNNLNEDNLFPNNQAFIENNPFKELPLGSGQKSERDAQYGNLIEESIENCTIISKKDDIHNELTGALTSSGEQINSEVCIDHIKNNILQLDDHNKNVEQTLHSDDFSSTPKKYDDLNEEIHHKLSDKPHFFLKRSLSDSALEVYDGNADELSKKKSFLLAKKRKKCSNSNNIEDSHLFNIIQNSRRNSISTTCNENNISFCILIDDNCIIAEENYEPEDVTFSQTDGSCLNDIEEENCHEITANLDTEDEIECEGEKTWVENVVYEEIIETEDIAENIVIGEPTSPKDTDSSDYESDDGDMGILNSAAIDHSNKVKHIYGDNMCTNDAQFVDALYRTPQMDVNKKLMDKESQITEKNKYYDSDSLEMLLAEPIDNYKCSELPRESISKCAMKDVRCKKDSSSLAIVAIVTNPSVPETENSECRENSSFSNINDESIKTPARSCEPCLDNVFSYERQEDGSYTSSSPEVSSTTSEEKNSSILLKISNYNGSKISEVNSLSHMHSRKVNSCKFTEKEYLHPNCGNHSQRPLITKAAQKYIPPLKETIPDLKVKLTLPQKSLLKLKENKASKEEPKHSTCSKSCNENSIQLRKEIPKKVKPKFEDVLKNIDEVQFKKHKDRNKKSRKIIPKVVIKKTGNGSHYASTSAKTSFNPDLTGRKWQPWVFIEKNVFVDKMALRNKTKAVFSHRKKTFVLDETLCKYKSISSAKFIITQPTLNEFSTGNLKYTIKLKHS